jgi:hypothetical protein
MAKIKLVKLFRQPGTQVWLHPDWGYKPCANRGLHRAFLTPSGEVVCPGCNRTCLLPEGFEHGQEFIAVATPEVGEE